MYCGLDTWLVPWCVGSGPPYLPWSTGDARYGCPLYVCMDLQFCTAHMHKQQRERHDLAGLQAVQKALRGRPSRSVSSSRDSSSGSSSRR